MKHGIAALIALMVLTTGCSKEQVISEESAQRPAELVAFEQQVPVRYEWSAQLNFPGKRQRFNLIPVVVDGKVYVAEATGRVACYDAKTGLLVWDQLTKETLSGGVGVGGGLAAVGTERGEVIALDATQGQLKWRVALTSEILSAPQISAGKVVVPVNDGKLVGLDAANGQRVWVSANTVPALSLRGASRPVIVDERVIAGFANGHLVAVNLHNGKRLWETTVAVAKGRSEIERLVDVDGTPRVADGVIYAVTYQGQVAAIALESGQVLWTRDMSSYQDIALDAQRVYVSDAASNVWALDRKTGATLWRQDKLKYRMTTAPALQGDYVVVGDFQGYLHWMALDDGHFVARVHISEADHRAKVLGRVKLPDDDDTAAVLRDKPGIAAAPSGVADRLYVRDTQGLLAAYRIGS